MKDIDTEIKELEKQIERLKREKEEKAALTDAEKIAIIIHDVYDKCHDDAWDYNITEYNVPDFTKMPAAGYLSLATKQLTLLDRYLINPDVSYQVLKQIHEYKKTLRTY
jgi:hypothetical protein